MYKLVVAYQWSMIIRCDLTSVHTEVEGAELGEAADCIIDDRNDVIVQIQRLQHGHLGHATAVSASRMASVCVPSTNPSMAAILLEARMSLVRSVCSHQPSLSPARLMPRLPA